MSRILIIEDNRLNRDLLTRRLVRERFDVSSAEDGRQGLDAVRREMPDLILLDLSLPEIDGWEVARRLKADDATSAIPIIAVTAHAMAGDRERALAAGCDEYDTKPVELRRLLGKMRALLPQA
jgi:CheY-like chemotaxis protein